VTINIDLLAGLGDAQRDQFLPVNGQTIFTLSRQPHDPTDVQFVINNVLYTEGSTGGDYFTVSGTTLTWLDVFVIDSGDAIEAIYYPQYGA